jgi:hypothetical protein
MGSPLPHACRAALLAALLLAATPGGGCRTAPVRQVQRTALAVPATITQSELSEAFWAAGRREGWRVREVAPGKLRAEKSLRSHRALVEIDYDASGYTITLVETDNLLQDGGRIHKTYNLWIEGLQKSIEQEFRFRSP